MSSDLSRAVRTAQPLADLLGLPVILDPRLRERSMGVWEGLTRDEVVRRHPEQYAHWVAGLEAPSDGSESRSELAERAVAALADAEGETVVLVTHSATAMALTGRLLGLPVAGWRAVGPLANGRWSELSADEHGWRLCAHNLGPLGLPVAGLSTVGQRDAVGGARPGHRRRPADAEALDAESGPVSRRREPAGRRRLLVLPRPANRVSWRPIPACSATSPRPSSGPRWISSPAPAGPPATPGGR